MLDEMPTEEPRGETTTIKKFFIIVVFIGILYLFFRFGVIGVIKALAGGRGFGAS